MKEGDVYLWQFKNDLEYRKICVNGTAYWCMDQQAIVINGELIDTYWVLWDKYGVKCGSSNSVVNPNVVDLQFVCNIKDIEYISKWQVEDYDKVYDLSYQRNCRHLYAIDKGAKPSKSALIKKNQKLLEEAKYRLKSAMWDIERYEQELKNLEEM